MIQKIELSSMCNSPLAIKTKIYNNDITFYNIIYRTIKKQRLTTILKI